MSESTFLNPAAVIAAADIHEGLHVADLGAGSGFFTRAAARAVGEGGVVWAVDVHRDMLPRIKTLSRAEGLTNVEVVHGDAQVAGGTHLPSGGFDAAIAANILFSIEDKPEFISEIRRILKPHGFALIIDWSDSHGGLGPHPDHVITRDEALPLFESRGFALVRNIHAGEFHWGFVVRKKTA